MHIRQSGLDLERCPSWGLQRAGVHDQDYKPTETNMPSSGPSGSSEADGASSVASSSDDKPPELTDELHEFAEWIFGPQGIQSLLVLAVGDFSYSGRFADTNVLLCRMSGPFQQRHGKEGPRNFYRHLTRSDRVLWENLEKHSNFLEACPTDSGEE